MSSPAPPAGSPDGPPPSAPGWLRQVANDERTAFLLVGAANTAIGFVAFFGFDDLFAVLLPGLAGVARNTVVLGCAHVVTVLCAFVLYRRLVFRVRGHVWRDLARFESVYLTAVAVNWVLLNLLVEGAHLSAKLAQTLILALTAVFSWFGHKYFSFRRAPRQGPWR